jgi:hypothetical protein
MKTKNKTAPKRVNAPRVKVPVSTQFKLWLRAGGRCQFDGCNRPVYVDGLTLRECNLANVAHIVADSVDGPRGQDPLPRAERNHIENLMLMCLDHHHLVDDPKYAAEYPKEVLQQWKLNHESRVENLLSQGPSRKTTVIQLLARIGSEAPVITALDMLSAIRPDYPRDREGICIDLTAVPEGGSDYWQSCKKIIRQRLSCLHSHQTFQPAHEHVSVFALAPIPLLMCLGRELGNKIPAALFQRHRDDGTWVWKDGGEPITFDVSRRVRGSTPNRVALVLSLSGVIAETDLPECVRSEMSIYEVTPVNVPPNPNLVRTRADLEEFRLAFHRAISLIKAENPEIEDIFVFPAVPSPIAVLCGRELLEKAHPTMVVFDFRKNEKRFVETLRINDGT